MRGDGRMKAPLFRRVNTLARGVHHHHGGDYRHQRDSKLEQESDRGRGRMTRGVRRGLDYTPLFRFLLSHVGDQWVDVHREAAGRLNSQEPIFWLVAQREHEKQDVVRTGESTYYSGLFVDDDGRLQLVNPSLGPSSLDPDCGCCTHTFNGVPFTRRYRADDRN